MPHKHINSFAVEQASKLDALAARIRTALEAARVARSNALDRALDAGDALNMAQSCVSSGWKRWLRTNCFLSPSTALLYQQLARHRSEIEAKIEEIGELSLRAARLLVTKRKPAEPETTESTEPGTTKTTEPPLITAINNASDAELTAALAALGFDRFMRVMPDQWRPKLEARAGGQIIRRAKARHPNTKLKNLKLEVVGGTELARPR